jgi:hypothetical protein
VHRPTATARGRRRAELEARTGQDVGERRAGGAALDGPVTSAAFGHARDGGAGSDAGHAEALRLVAALGRAAAAAVGRAHAAAAVGRIAHAVVAAAVVAGRRALALAGGGVAHRAVRAAAAVGRALAAAAVGRVAHLAAGAAVVAVRGSTVTGRVVAGTQPLAAPQLPPQSDGHWQLHAAVLHPGWCRRRRRRSRRRTRRRTWSGCTVPLGHSRRSPPGTRRRRWPGCRPGPGRSCRCSRARRRTGSWRRRPGWGRRRLHWPWSQVQMPSSDRRSGCRAARPPQGCSGGCHTR